MYEARMLMMKMMILFLDFKASQSSQSRLKTAFLVVLRGSNRLWSDEKRTFVKVERGRRRLNRLTELFPKELKRKNGRL